MTFMAFESFEDMQRFMAEREREANEDLTPARIQLRDAIGERCYWIRLDWEVPIFGEAWSLEETFTSERRCFGETLNAEEQAELEYTTERMAESRARGYLFGKAYSVYEPAGELGSTHVAEVVPIPKMMFLLAKANGWTIPNDEDE